MPRRSSWRAILLSSTSNGDPSEHGENRLKLGQIRRVIAPTAVEAQRRRWNAEIPAKDAALADRDVAYGEYLDYVQNAWKRPCGVVAGGRR
jgi:hypothetical protein